MHSLVRVPSAVAELHGDRLAELSFPHLPGRSPRTPLEKLFRRVDAFCEVTSGEWDDPARFGVPQGPESVEDGLLYC